MHADSERNLAEAIIRIAGRNMVMLGLVAGARFINFRNKRKLVRAA
jgi:hypothetical protein